MRKIIYIFAIPLFCIFYNHGFSQVPFLEILDPNQEELDSMELESYNSVTGIVENHEKNLIRINPLADYFTFDTLKIQVPLSEIGEISFATVGSQYRSDSSYYWVGYNLDGSGLRMGVYETGIIGTMFIVENQTRYQFSSISDNYGVLIKYPTWKEIEPNFSCITTGEDGDQEDYYPDEFSEDSLSFGAEERSVCDHNRIRVLVLHSENARIEARRDGVNLATVANNLIDELNTTNANTGISSSRIHFVLADVRLLPNFIEGNNIQDDVSALPSNQLAQQMRDETFADLVILISDNNYVGNQGIAGIAREIRAKNSRAYAISALNPTINNFTGTHEIGHLIGTRHQRCTRCLPGCDSKWSNYKGYHIGDNMRTVMRTQACGRERVPVWSSSGAKFMGMSTGYWRNRNSGIIKNRASRVACFRKGSPPGPPPPPQLIYYIDGPMILCPSMIDDPNYKVVYNKNIFNNPSFSWDMSRNGISNWVPIPSFIDHGDEITLTNFQNLPDFFVLRVTVSDNSGNNATATFPVRYHDVLDCSALRILPFEEDNNVNSEAVLYPNPTTSDIFVAGVSGHIRYYIFSSTGKFMKKGSSLIEDQEELRLSLEGYPPATYLLVLEDESNNESSFKIVKK